jgi:hypothetical protein
MHVAYDGSRTRRIQLLLLPARAESNTESDLSHRDLFMSGRSRQSSRIKGFQSAWVPLHDIGCVKRRKRHCILFWGSVTEYHHNSSTGPGKAEAR